MVKKLSYKDYNKQITTHDIGNVQSHDQEKNKLNSTINVNSGGHTLTHAYVVISKTNNILTKILLLSLWNRCNGADLMFLFLYQF